jgi:ABC-type polysaccharide/polyol phosphate transport system ATPase subunit
VAEGLWAANALNSGKMAGFIVSCRPSLHFYFTEILNGKLRLHHEPRGQNRPAQAADLKDISLSFFPGAKIGVLGLNGSGKSTC